MSEVRRSTVAGTPYDVQFYSARDGLKLAVRVWGERKPDQTPIICLSGLSRNGLDFECVGDHFHCAADTKRQVFAFDYRGRGLSEYDEDASHYTLAQELDDVFSGMAALGLHHAHFIGTSRGGLIIMLMAAARPAVMRSAVLNDVGPELNPKGLIRIKRSLEAMPQFASWHAAAEALKTSQAKFYPHFSASDWMRFAQQIFKDEDGKPVRNFDLKLLQTLKGLDASSALPTMWPQFIALSALPTLAIRGSLSDLLSKECFEEMSEKSSSMKQYIVEDEGHAPVLWQANVLKAIENNIER